MRDLTEEEKAAYLQANHELQDVARQVRSHFDLNAGCIIIGALGEGLPKMIAISSNSKAMSLEMLQDALAAVRMIPDEPSGGGMLELWPPTEGSA